MLLGGGDPATIQARQAAKLRGTQDFSGMLQGANDQGHSLDLLNFAAQNSNNPGLAKSVAAMAQNQQSQYEPTKLDKGVYIPATGQYQESPGVADEKQADRESRMLQAAGVMQSHQDVAAQQAQWREDQIAQRREAAQQADATRQMMIGVLGQTRAAQRDAAQAKSDQAEQDRQLRMYNTVTGRMATLGRTTNLPALIGSSTELVNRLQPYVDKGQADSIPGLTVADHLKAMLPVPLDMSLGQEGAQNMAMSKSAILDQLKTQVGLGGTNRARDEQQIETLSGMKAGSQDFINAYNNAIHPRLEQTRQAMLGVASGLTPDQWDQYVNAGGIDYRKPIPKIVLQAAKGASAPKATVTPGAPLHFDAQGNPLP